MMERKRRSWVNRRRYGDKKDMIVLFRRGNDSQVGVQILRKVGPEVRVRNVVGGLHAWARDVDPIFPAY